MRSSFGTQRWVALLPIAVVMLPTVCLLWFMTQAVRNERLAVRQKLVDAYRATLADTRANTERRWAAAVERLVRDLPTDPLEIFRTLMATPPEANDPDHPFRIQAMMVCGPSGQVLYPRLDLADSPQAKTADRSDLFQEAWQAEYVQGNLSEAATLYQRLAQRSPDVTVQVSATIGAVRCLAKIGQARQAAILAQQTLAEFKSPDSHLAALLVNLRIESLQIMAGSGLPQYPEKAREFFQEALDYQALDLTSRTRAFALAKAIDLLPQDLARGPLVQQVRIARALREAELQSMQASEQMSAADALGGGTAAGSVGQVKRLQAEGFWGLRVEKGGNHLLLIFDKTHLTECLSRLIRQDLRECLSFRFVDEKGQPDRDVDSDATFLGTYAVGGFLPAWAIDVFFKGDSLFKEAARRQQALYIWIGTLVIVLIVVAAAVSTQAIHRQIRLNRLKNDFIATVTHELKTPLASMRVLVDTLIEGRTKDSGQAAEYLQLIAKENLRLTGLIDNFLTFSRMERNKQAFALVPTDPALVVQDAVEAVRTKFGMADCQFQVDVDKDLPIVMADHDALVTVLVNLLDNACKYTGARKEISLRVWAGGHAVYFSVSDNGVGIPRRSMRRIFEKFYQVDQTLSRKAGGCGLGLAIVKFIADAHHATVGVDSTVGQGSTFTVRLPARAS
jgi:signal transduction histidine kinase